VDIIEESRILTLPLLTATLITARLLI